MGSNEQTGARDAVLRAEQQRQRQFQEQSQSLFDTTLPKAGMVQHQNDVTAAADTRLKADSGLLEKGDGVSTAAIGHAPQEVGSSYARAARGALDRGKNQAKRNAAVGGYKDASTKLGTDLGRASQWQNIFGTNAVASSGLVGGELENANYAGGGTRGIGQLLGAGGQVAGMYGMTDKAPTWPDVFGGATSPEAAMKAYNAAPAWYTKPGF